MGKIRLQIAPDVEFKMDLEVEGIDSESRDYAQADHSVELPRKASFQCCS